MDTTNQYRDEMRAAWDTVDDDYRSEDILGEKAASLIMRHAARASHHEFPFGMTVMAQLFGCTNGATTEVFPGVDSPLVLPVLNINYPQTRKSSGFATGNTVGRAIDGVVLEIAQKNAADTLAPHAGTSQNLGSSAQPVHNGANPAAAQLKGMVKIHSSTLTSFTDAAFFQRCAGDWDQIVPSERHNASGRCHFSTLINLDEAYKYLKMVGVISNVAQGKGNDSGPGVVPDAASEVNKLFQTGIATLATKTAGTFGEGAVPSISLGLTGNAHPAIVIPMLRGDLGTDVAACSYRHLFTTGVPIEPHETLLRRLLLPSGNYSAVGVATAVAMYGGTSRAA
jgi:hypothetical protein